MPPEMSRQLWTRYRRIYFTVGPMWATAWLRACLDSIANGEGVL